MRYGQISSNETVVDPLKIVEVIIDLPEWFGAPQRMDVSPEEIRQYLTINTIDVKGGKFYTSIANISKESVKFIVSISNIPPNDDESNALDWRMTMDPIIMKSVGIVNPGTKVIIKRVNKVDEVFRIERLNFDNPECWHINEILVGPRCQFAVSGGLPASVLEDKTESMMIETIRPQEMITFEITNISDIPRFFQVKLTVLTPPSKKN